MPKVAMTLMPARARVALTREVSSAMERCELTHLPRSTIDLALARAQHAAYEQALRELGCRVQRLVEEPELADSVFVEDTALVLDELAVIARPGAASRRAETATIADALGALRPLARIEVPGTLDGGDVLCVDRKLYVGVSSRSNRAGIEQLRLLLSPRGYAVEPVQLRGGLHLKSAVTQVGPTTLLINTRWVDRRHFTGADFLEVDEAEPLAANAVLVGQSVIYSVSNPATAERLRNRGIDVRTVEMSEVEKAQGAVTCCSVIFSVVA